MDLSRNVQAIVHPPSAEPVRVHGYYTFRLRCGLIVGLGLGGSGQDIDTTSPVVPLGRIHIATSFNLTHNFNKRAAHARFARSIYGSGTRCPHRKSAGEVCQRLSGTSLARLNSYTCVHSSI